MYLGLGTKLIYSYKINEKIALMTSVSLGLGVTAVGEGGSFLGSTRYTYTVKFGPSFELLKKS